MVLTFGSVSLAYINTDLSASQALASNKFFILSVVLTIYWGATLLAMRGTKMFSNISKYCGFIRTIIPAILLITLSFSYVFIAGNKPQINISISAIFLDLTKFDDIVLAASIFLFYAGMEMNSL